MSEPQTEQPKPLTHYWAQYQPGDKSNQFFVLGGDVLNSEGEVKAANDNPVAAAVGYLLTLSRYKTHFNTKATTSLYVDLGCVKKILMPAEFQAFMASDESKAERLGPYKGFSQDPATRELEIALLNKQFPALFVKSAEPEGYFDIICAAG